MRLLSTGVEMQSNTRCRGDCAAHRGEAVGQLSALPAGRPGPAKKACSVDVSLSAYFCLLESEEGNFIKIDCKDIQTDLLFVLFVERGRINAGEKKTTTSVFPEMCR